MICLENVYKEFDKQTVLSDISLHIPGGKTVGLIGASGAGKTTLIKLVCGLLEPTSGRIRTMLKEPVKNRKNREIGVLFGDKSLLQKYDTVEGNFNTLKNIFKIPDSVFKTGFSELSERLGFFAYKEKPVYGLSLGERMRAELGVVLLSRPKLLLLDEPAVGLDANAKKALHEILEERTRGGMTAVISSHDMPQISGLCSRIALLDKGKLCYYGGVEQFHRAFCPIETLIVKISGRFPDLEDLPVKSYDIENSHVKVSYDANHVTSAETIRLILKQTSAVEINIRKPSLESMIKERNYEQR